MTLCETNLISITIQRKILCLTSTLSLTKNSSLTTDFTKDLNSIITDTKSLLKDNKFKCNTYELVIRKLKELEHPHLETNYPNLMQEIKKIINQINDKCLEEYRRKFQDIKNNTKIENLYRFLPIDQYTYEHLKDKKLYMSKPKYFNDPFDCITFRPNNIRTLSQKEVFGHNKPMVRFNGNDLSQSIPILESLDDNHLRVKCFNKGSLDKIPQNWHLMMSHYAKDHKGIIIEYEFNNEQLNNQNVRFLEVKYTDKIGVSNIEAGLSNKAECWGYEEEYRFAYWKDKDAPDKLPLNMLGLKIKKIIFLVNTDENDRNDIINSLDIDFTNFENNSNKVLLKVGEEIEFKQTVMKDGYSFDFKIEDQSISLDTERLKVNFS